jgi:NAD(P)-dependent dehydrogenase (short-subunit alcohol dehydrogenase family)
MVIHLNQVPQGRKAYIITGPTSGIGLRTAQVLAGHGLVVLVGRDRGKLAQVQQTYRAQRTARGGEIIALRLPIAGLLNNAGIFPKRAITNALGWDLAFTTNHIGPPFRADRGAHPASARRRNCCLHLFCC